MKNLKFTEVAEKLKLQLKKLELDYVCCQNRCLKEIDWVEKLEPVELKGI